MTMWAKSSLLLVFFGSALYLHLRGKARLPLLRQMVNHTVLFAPYNVLMYWFSRVPTTPLLNPRNFPDLDLLRAHWPTIRDEAVRLFEDGHIRAAAQNDDAGFGSFFKRGWKRFYLTWYDGPLPSAVGLCPQTVALLAQVPRVKGAMFALLPAGGQLTPHRDPFAGSLRYHLGLVTPNSDECCIHVDGQRHVWRDGEDLVFDETYVHWAHNATDQHRIILFCDLERPLHTRPMAALNRWVSRHLGRATATQNVPGERVGGISRAYAWSHRFGQHKSARFKAWKHGHRGAYQGSKALLVVLVIGGLAWWLVS